MPVKVIKNTIRTSSTRAIKAIDQNAITAATRAMTYLRTTIISDPSFPVKTGRFRLSVSDKNSEDAIDSVSSKGTVVTGIVGTKVPYAAFLEFGTSRIAPRHSFLRGYIQALDGMKSIIRRAMQV